MTGVRSHQREVTRGLVLKTARNLFRDSTFDQVGVRDIAAETGVATGTVIAAFGSKGDLLTAIILEDLQLQLAAMEEAVVGIEKTSDRIFALCMACIAYQSPQMSIVRASMADSWIRPDEAENCVRAAIKPLLLFVIGELERGVERGEVQPGVNFKLASQMLFDTVVSSYRLFIYNDCTLQELRPLLQERINFLMKSIYILQTCDHDKHAHS